MLPRLPLIFLVLALSAGGAAIAQIPGTMYGDIRDEKDQPLPGVKIKLTDPVSPSTLLEFESDDRGRYTIFVPNSLPTYTITLTKPGYQVKELSGIKIPARQRMRGNLTMTSSAAAEAAMAATAGDTDTSAVEDAGGGYIELYNKGVEALNMGDLATAKVRFEESIEKKADYGPAHGGISKVYWKQQNWELAKKHGELSLQLNPTDDTVNQVLYAAYSGLGEKDKAETVLAKMQASNPEKAGRNMFNSAADLYNAGQMAEAKELFIKILNVDPNQAKAQFMLGMCYISEGANAEAKTHLTKFIELAPNDPDAALAQEMLDYLE